VSGDDSAQSAVLTIPWRPRGLRPQKGIATEPGGSSPLDPHSRDTLLTAIGKARAWLRDLTAGRVGSFEEIARREGKGERQIRMLLPLACVSPRIIAAIVDGIAPAGLTVTALAHALPYAWSEQERQFQIA